MDPAMAGVNEENRSAGKLGPRGRPCLTRRHGEGEGDDSSAKALEDALVLMAWGEPEP